MQGHNPFVTFPETIPDTLKHLPYWVNWNYGEARSDGRLNKVPSCKGKDINCLTPRNWKTFTGVVTQIGRGADGIGFVLTLESGLIGIDLDTCRDPETGAITTEAQSIVDTTRTYWEVSPSGTGLRGFVRGVLPQGRMNKVEHFEVYAEKRFLTVTGKRLPGTLADVCDADESFHNWYTATFPLKTVKTPSPSSTTSTSVVDIPDAELITKIRSSEKGPRFARLYDSGDLSAYGNDHSRADAALCGMLAFWTGKDAERMDAIFRTSALMRDKWDEQHGSCTYGEMTIQSTIEGCEKTYNPKYRKSRQEGREGNTEVHGRGDSLAQPSRKQESGFAANLSDSLYQMERELQQLGVQTQGGFTLPPGLDREDAVKIGRVLKFGTDKIQMLLKYLWARWYAQLPKGKGSKIKAVQDLFGGADNFNAINKQKELCEDAGIVERVPADAWDFSKIRPWTFYEHLARLHDKPERQAHYLQVTPYKGMYKDMKAEYAPEPETLQSEQANVDESGASFPLFLPPCYSYMPKDAPSRSQFDTLYDAMVRQCGEGVADALTRQFNERIIAVLMSSTSFTNLLSVVKYEKGKEIVIFHLSEISERWREAEPLSKAA